jgi:hypothetical protein
MNRTPQIVHRSDRVIFFKSKEKNDESSAC